MRKKMAPHLHHLTKKVSVERESSSVLPDDQQRPLLSAERTRQSYRAIASASEPAVGKAHGAIAAP